MIPAETSTSDTGAAAARNIPQKAGEYFLRVVVVVLGIVLGLIAALFVGLFANWIPINC